VKTKDLGHCVTFGDFALYPEAGELQKFGHRLKHVRPQQVAFLTILLENAGTRVAKEAISARLWPDEAPTKNHLNVVASRVWTALGDTNKEQRKYFTSLGGGGYCFIHPIKRVERATGYGSDAYTEQVNRSE
jgi:DNA-binding winged helix-turn-helix (wHTH) protein